jgi:hypothetical protein
MPHPPTLASAFGRGGLLVLERLLAVVGVLLLGLYAAACAELGATQRAAGRSFDRALATRLALEQHDQSEWAPGRVQRFEIARQDPVTPLGRLEIPDAGVSVMILDGTGDSVLDRAVGRIEGTARLGEVGRPGLAPGLEAGLACVHDEALGRVTYEVEGVAGHQGEALVGGRVEDLDIPGRHHPQRVDEVVRDAV